MSSKTTKKQTKPKIQIDMAEVERLAGLGLTQEEIACSLGIAASTFYNHKAESGEIGDAIKRGKASAAQEVSNQLFQRCKNGDLGAIIWYEKTRRGLSDKVSVKIEDVDRAIETELARISGGSEA